jgi:hypothetical protein
VPLPPAPALALLAADTRWMELPLRTSSMSRRSSRVCLRSWKMPARWSVSQSADGAVGAVEDALRATRVEADLLPKYANLTSGSSASKLCSIAASASLSSRSNAIEHTNTLIH